MDELKKRFQAERDKEQGTKQQFQQENYNLMKNRGNKNKRNPRKRLTS